MKIEKNRLGLLDEWNVRGNNLGREIKILRLKQIPRWARKRTKFERNFAYRTSGTQNRFPYLFCFRRSKRETKIPTYSKILPVRRKKGERGNEKRNNYQ